MTTKPTLYLLDGMALIYRAYYAMMPTRMQTKDNFPTGAIFGFTNTLLEILTHRKPDYIAVSFDTKVKTFRHHAYPPYKANRPVPPDDILMQFPKVFEMTDALGIKRFNIEGYEADDVIGTLAKQFEHDCNVVIVTPDKDFSQLVNDAIKVARPGKRDDELDVLDRNGIKEKYGVFPEDFIQMLALMGDTSDNVPGADGVGPKTAAALINEYRTIKNLIANIDKLTKAKIKANILAVREQLTLSEFLVTIKTDVPMSVSLNDLKALERDNDTLTRLLKELEFRQFMQRLGLSVAESADTPLLTYKKSDRSKLTASADDATDELSFDFGANVNHQTLETTPHTYTLINTMQAFDDLVATLSFASEFSFDTETTSLTTLDAELVGMSFALREGEAFFVDCTKLDFPLAEILAKAKPLLEDTGIGKVGQNIKYDILVMKNYGIDIFPVKFDTMLASYVLNPDAKHGMDDMARGELGYSPVSYETLVGKGKVAVSILAVDKEKLSDYAAEDADITLKLKNVFDKKLSADPRLQKICTDIEFPLVSVLARMERAGVKIDTGMLADISKELDGELKVLTKEIHALAEGEFNIDSPKQLGEILFDKLGLPSGRRTKTGYSTDVRVLEDLAPDYVIAEKVLEYRSLVKLKSTYVDSLPTLIHAKTGKLHTSFNQHIASTGRLSSTDPNLQNIPIRTARGKEIRKAFVASDDNHVLISADYSQIELRIAAYISQDENLLNAFAAKEDIHTATARIIFDTQNVTKDMRRKAKEVNFGVLYGIMPFGLSQRLDISQGEAKQIIETYKAKYPKLAAYTATTLDFARKHNYVETLLGRRRYIQNLGSKNYSIRSAAERAAVNTPIQGTAADMIKLAMLDIDAEMKKRRLKSAMILQVHDELVFDALKSEEAELTVLVHQLLVASGGKAGVTGVAIEAEVGSGSNWLDAH
jgi:DNA polymerase-1